MYIQYIEGETERERDREREVVDDFEGSHSCQVLCKNISPDWQTHFTLKVKCPILGIVVRIHNKPRGYHQSLEFSGSMSLLCTIAISLDIIKRSLEVKLPTIWTHEKAEVGRVREEKRKEEKRRSEKRKNQKTEDAGARKGSSGGSKSRLAKAAGAEPSGEMRDEKLHAVVARSTFRSQYVQNTPGSKHFLKLRI